MDQATRGGILQRVRDRKMAQWAFAYAAGAWVLLQVLGLAADSYEWPRLVMRTAIGAVVLGFLATLVLAWYHGERGEQKVGGTELLILALLLTVGGGVLWQVERSVRAPATTPADAVAAAPIAAKSIAVLPFANLSSDPDNAYFADGIQDEILTRLAKIGDLKVVSRTSTLRHASAPDNLPEIARQLGVAHVVEGSVQKIGQSVRINVQLIRADDDTHLWAEIYDRKLDDVFGIQSEVAGAIATALQATLTQAERRDLAHRPTANAAAYDAYLRGVSWEMRDIYLMQARLRARDQFAEAVRLDPGFAEAWARLVEVQSFLYLNGIEHTPAVLETMRVHADTVARLRPDSGEAWMARGYYLYRGLFDLPAALEAFEMAARRMPNHAGAFTALGYVERRLGRLDDALGHLVTAEQLDPGDPNNPQVVGEILNAQRRFPEAHAAFDRALALAPTDQSIGAGKYWSYQAVGDLDAADALLAQFSGTADGDATRIVWKIDQLLFRRRFDEMAHAARALQAAARTSVDGEVWEMQAGLFLGTALRLGGDAAAARVEYARLLRLVEARRGAGVDDAELAQVAALAHLELGDHAQALREIERSIVLAKRDAKQTPFLLGNKALIQARSGDTDAALDGLASWLVVPYGTTPALLRLDPEWDFLRHDPRFRKLSGEGAPAG